MANNEPLDRIDLIDDNVSDLRVGFRVVSVLCDELGHWRAHVEWRNGSLETSVVTIEWVAVVGRALGFLD